MTTTAKFQRDYLFSIQGNQDKTQFFSAQPPLTIEFDIVRNTFASANTGRFRIYNLAESTRKNLFHVRYDIDEKNYQKVQMFAGYKTNKQLPMVFLGNVFTASTKRAGPDWITEIEAFDGGVGMLTGQISLTKPKGWSAQEVLKTLVGVMPYTQFGAAGDITATNTRGISMIGNAWDIFKRIVGDGVAFVDMNNVYGLKENEYIVKPGQIELIVGSHNILGTPRRVGAIVEVDMVFEPSVFVGQAVTINSLETVYNGTYQLRGIHHRGTISEAVCGDAITTLSLWIGTKVLQAVQTK